MKISIVIPVHNEETCLAKVIPLALAQEYPDFEVIVVDNASTDGTADVAKKFPVKLVAETRKGLLFAREAGRLAATGDIIANLDADCLPEKDWLAKGSGFFADPKVVAVSGPYDYYDAASPFFRSFSLLAQKTLYVLMNHLTQLLKAGAVILGGNNFIRAEVLTKIGGYNTAILFYGEDTDTAKRISRYGRVVFTGRLVQKSSARRLASEGILRISSIYIMYFFKVIFSRV